MADGNGVIHQRGSYLAQIAELMEITLAFLPEKHLAAAAQVCRLWREIAERLRTSRRYSVTCFVDTWPVGHLSAFDFVRPALQTIDDLYIIPSAVILFTNFRPIQNFWFPKRILRELYINHLPKQCVLAGCTGQAIIGSTNCQRNSYVLTCETEKAKCLSVLLVPRAEDVKVRPFHMPLKNKYKKIRGIRAFLPDMNDAKLVIVFAHPLSLGKLTHLTLAVRDKYGDEVTIVGGYSDTFLFHHKDVTSNEIVGLVFGGNLRATSVIVDGNTKDQCRRSLDSAMTRLQNSGINSKNGFGLMFTCTARRNALYGCHGTESSAFSDTFPFIPLVGFSGTAAFGCDMEVLKLQNSKPGGRDFLQANATVFCLCSF